MKDNNDYLTQPTNQNLGHIADNDDWYLFGKAQSFSRCFYIIVWVILIIALNQALVQNRLIVDQYRPGKA